jgi:hypothetical protein
MARFSAALPVARRVKVCLQPRRGRRVFIHWESIRSLRGNRMAHDQLQQYLDCIAACNACTVACQHCASCCLQEPDVKMMTRCIALDLDCAQVCQVAVALMAGGSEHAPALCRVCADICRVCGEECAKHDQDHCQQCAEACRRCAEACNKVAAAAQP